jgi:hypothetical protein
MKKVIELLEDALDVMLHVAQIPESYQEAAYIKDAIAELKALPRRNSEGGRRVQCNWCESVFDEEHIKAVDDIEYCPVCGETGYLMDAPEAEAPPRWYTPEQWENHTGKPWPNEWAVYYRKRYKPTIFEPETWTIWMVAKHKSIKTLKNRYAPQEVQVVCAAEAGAPPDGWRPEEG